MEAALCAPRIDRPLVFTCDQLPADEYHAEQEHTSSSQLVRILKTPAHFKFHKEQGGSEPSELMKLGSCVHCALLEPKEFPHRYVFAPRAYDRRRNVDKDEIQSIQQAYPGRELVAPDDALMLRRLGDSIREHAQANALVNAPGQPELSIFWRDTLTGLRLKVRLDKLLQLGSSRTLLEVKTTDRADETSFGWKIADMDYDLRAVMYADGVQKAYGFTPDIVWLVIERETGFVATYRPTPRMLARAKARYERARLALAEALNTNEWPAYQSGAAIDTVDLPRRVRS